MNIKGLFAPMAMGLCGAIARRATMTLAVMMLTATTAWAQNPEVSYIDENGQTVTITDYYALTGSETPNSQGQVGLNNDVVVVNKDITYNEEKGLNLNFTGNEIKLILCDGCTLTINSNSSDRQFTVYKNLTIYGQTNNTGKLVVNATNRTAIDADVHTVTVNGGTVESTSTDSYGRGLRCGALVFNGGNLKLEGNAGVFCSNENNSSRTVTLNWRSASDRVYISSFFYVNTVNIGGAGGKCFTDGKGNYYGGTYTSGYSAFSGKELQPATARTLGLPDGVTATGALFTDSGVDYYAPGTTVTLSDLPAASAGYLDWQYTVNGTPIDGTSFTMPADATATVALTHQPDPTDFELTATDEYTIHTADGWGVFCDALQDNDTYNRLSGKTVKLGANISVTRMAGTSHHDFCGTFDGQGHTLQFTSNENVNGVAPFSYVSETTPTGGSEVSHPAIRNLNVVAAINTTATHASGLVGRMWGTLTIEGCTVGGTIQTSNQYAAGFIAELNGAVTISNSRSSVTINSSVDGDGTHGGIVAVNNNGSNLTIEGCVFDGKLLTTNGTIKCGGFIGWRGGTAEIRNSLYAPASPTGSETWVGNSGSATFARNGVDTYNCYYTTLFCDGTDYVPSLTDGTVSPAKWSNGKAARSIEAGANVTISNLALTGTPTEYNVSGITAYSGGGLALDNGATLYYGSCDVVSLTLSNSATGAPLGYQYGYSASAGTISGYMLTMADANATVNVDTDVLLSTGQPVSVSYIDAAGTTDSHDAIALDETMTSLAANQWYFVGKDIDYTQTVILGGNTTLILADGCTLNIGTSSERMSSGYCIDGSVGYKDLTIYGQSGQSGSLNAYNSASDSNPVKVNNYTQHGGNVTIDGTKITALESIRDITITRGTLTANTDDDGTWGKTAIRSGTGRNVSVRGGTVNATGRYAISGALNITAGTVNATGSFAAIYSSTTVSGGNLNATGGSYSIYDNISFTGGSANVTLTGDIYKNLTIAAGLVFTDGTNYYAGTLTDNEETAISGKTLTRLTALPLADAADNTAVIDKCNGATDIDITLQGRTLYKDDKWNTLCLPFSLTAEQIAASPLADCTLMALDGTTSNLTNGTLTLTFTTAESITAGTPYIIKWAAGDDIVDPVFSNVTIDKTMHDVATNDSKVTFKGSYDYQSFDAEDKDILFLGGGSTLYYPQDGASIGACRAYFQLNQTVGGQGEDTDVKAFVLNFGDETTAVTAPLAPGRGVGGEAWYDLNGRRFIGMPAQKGIYIINGKKVVVK